MLTTNLNWTANWLGILSLLGLSLAFSPAITNIFNYKYNNNRTIITAAYWGLIIAIFFGLSHGLLMTQKENINFYDLKTYWTYSQGLLTFNLLIFLAFSFTEIKLNLKKICLFYLCFIVFSRLSSLGVDHTSLVSHVKQKFSY